MLLDLNVRSDVVSMINGGDIHGAVRRLELVLSLIEEHMSGLDLGSDEYTYSVAADAFYRALIEMVKSCFGGELTNEESVAIHDAVLETASAEEPVAADELAAVADEQAADEPAADQPVAVADEPAAVSDEQAAGEDEQAAAADEPAAASNESAAAADELAADQLVVANEPAAAAAEPAAGEDELAADEPAAEEPAAEEPAADEPAADEPAAEEAAENATEDIIVVSEPEPAIIAEPEVVVSEPEPAVIAEPEPPEIVIAEPDPAVECNTRYRPDQLNSTINEQIGRGNWEEAKRLLVSRTSLETALFVTRGRVRADVSTLCRDFKQQEALTLVLSYDQPVLDHIENLKACGKGDDPSMSFHKAHHQLYQYIIDQINLEFQVVGRNYVTETPHAFRAGSVYSGMFIRKEFSKEWAECTDMLSSPISIWDASSMIFRYAEKKAFDAMVLDKNSEGIVAAVEKQKSAVNVKISKASEEELEYWENKLKFYDFVVADLRLRGIDYIVPVKMADVADVAEVAEPTVECISYQNG